MSSNTANHPIGKSYTDKLARNASVLSTLYALPIAAQAGVVHVTAPLTISIDDARAFDYQPVDWDVDGDSVADFRLEAFRTIVYSSGSNTSRPYGNLQLNSSNLNGQGMVQNTGDAATSLKNLNPGETVGPVLDPGNQWSPSVNRTMMTSSSYSGFSTDLVGAGNLIGFRFLANGDQTLYGWAELSLDEAALSMTIEQWAYEDNGGGIKVGQVPLPPSALLMLSGLALGAGGVLRGRKARIAAQEHTKNS